MTTAPYQIFIPPGVIKAIAKIDPAVGRRINAAIRALAQDPRPPGCLKMTGSDEWRIRIGDYRVIYTITDPVRRVLVVHVAHRREVYR